MAQKLIAGIGGWDNSHYAAPAGAFGGAAPFIASALFQANGPTGTEQVIWGNLDVTNHTGWQLSLSDTGSLVAKVGDGSTIQAITLDTGTALFGTWALATVTWTGANVSLFLNGADVAGSVGTVDLAAAATAACVGVRSDQTLPFEGLIAGVTYSENLTANLGGYFTEVARTLEIGMSATGDLCGVPLDPPDNAWQVQLFNDKIVAGLPKASWPPAQGTTPLTRVDTAGACVYVQSTPPVFSASGAASSSTSGVGIQAPINDDTGGRGWIWGFRPEAVNPGVTSFFLELGQAYDHTNTKVITSDVFLPVDLTAHGAGGLDTGSLFANTFYFTYVIWGSGPGAAALVSLSPTTPVLPAGYTLFRRTGTVRTNGGSTLYGLNVIGHQNERWHCYDYDDVSINLGAVPVTLTALNLSTVLPSTAARARYTANLTATSGGTPTLQISGYSGSARLYTHTTVTPAAATIARSWLETLVAPGVQLYGICSDINNAVVLTISQWLEIV